MEQFHASLRLGPSIIFIDGLSEIENQYQPVKLAQWLPKNINENSKFVLTLRKSTEWFAELASYNSSLATELVVFKVEEDYYKCFAKLLNTNVSVSSNGNGTGRLHDPNNCLYNKSCSIYSGLKSANHATNPLFVQLIAKELFCFDHEIYRGHPMFHRKSTTSSLFSTESRASMLSENHIIDSYLEDVSTLREVIQKILNRYLVKRYNWSTVSTMPLSKGMIYIL